MATYTIPSNEKTRVGKKLAALLELLKEVVSISVVRKSKGMDEALEDAKHGHVTEDENAKDLINNANHNLFHLEYLLILKKC